MLRLGLPQWLRGKEFACNAGDPSLIAYYLISELSF